MVKKDVLDNLAKTFAEMAKIPEFSHCCSFLPDIDQPENLPLVAFIGEFKRGKTSIINGLLGKGDQKTGSTNDITVYRSRNYSEKSWERAIQGTPKFPEVKVEKVNAPILENMILIDTPGFNDPLRSVDDLVFAILPRCEKIFLVLSAEQALSHSEEKIVRRLLTEERNKLCLILHKCDALQSMDEFSELEHRVKRKLGRFIARVEMIPASMRNTQDFAMITGLQHLENFLHEEMRKYSQKYSCKIADRFEFVLDHLKLRYNAIEGDFDRIQQEKEKREKARNDIRLIYRSMLEKIHIFVEKEIDRSKTRYRELTATLTYEKLSRQCEEILEQETQDSVECIVRKIFHELKSEHDSRGISDRALSPFYRFRSWGKICCSDTFALQDNTVSTSWLISEAILEKILRYTPLKSILGGLVGELLMKTFKIFRQEAWDKKQREVLETHILLYYDKITAQVINDFGDILEEMLSVEMEFFEVDNFNRQYSREELKKYKQMIELACEQLQQLFKAYTDFQTM